MGLADFRRWTMVTAAAAAIAMVAGMAPRAVLAQTQAETQLMAFKQAVAEAAADDREVAAFYRANGYQPIWTGNSEADKARRRALFAGIERAKMHALPVDRYNSDELMRTLRNVRTLRDRGFAEVKMSKALVRLAKDMQSGALVPSQIDPGIKREIEDRDVTAYLVQVSQGDPRKVIRAFAPRTAEYNRLMKEKLRLERLMMAGGWGATVPAGKLEPGQSGPAVVMLRDRLMAMGYLPRTSTSSYDGNIQAAVRGFQQAHGLEPDGVAGGETMTEINQPIEARLRSIIVAMERERWLNRDRGQRHILVNLTDFSARIVDNDAITFQTRAVVGKNTHDRRSPEFSDEMEHMVINPTWHVPRSIAVNEYLPQLQRNRNAASHLRLVNSRGQTVSRAGINFGAYSARTFPFDLKQPPSSRNALGLVKFMFPNKYNIYLHDTPAKSLFERAKRDFSHGCIRLQQPFEFAYEILSKQVENPKEFFHARLRTGAETRVDLEQKIPVHIIYRTAFTDAKGQLQFRRDVYGRDARIWAALQRQGVGSPRLQQANLPAAYQPEESTQRTYASSGQASRPAKKTRRSSRSSHTEVSRGVTDIMSGSAANRRSSGSRRDR